MRSINASRTRLFVVALVFLLGLSAPTWAQRPGAPTDNVDLTVLPTLRLKAATFTPAREAPPLPERLQGAERVARPAQSAQALYLVQFRGPIQVAWRERLAAFGVTILDYIPDWAYKVKASEQALEEVRRMPEVVWAGPFEPGYRLSPSLGLAEEGVAAQDAQRVLAIRAEMEPEVKPDAAALARRLDALGLMLIGIEGSSFVAQGTPAQIEALAHEPDVRWIAPLRIPRALNDVAAGLISANQAWNAGLTGAGQLVNVADTGLDTGRDYPHTPNDIHRDIEGRIVHMHSWPISTLWHRYLNNPLDDDGPADLDYGHGTHVVGTALGNGSRSNGRYRGAAYGAQLTFQALEQYCDWNASAEAQGETDGYELVGIPADLGDLYQQAYDWGARVHNNSWGFEGHVYAGLYTEDSRQTDRFVWEHRDMVILCAAGNDGRDANGDGRTDGRSIAPPATAKNVIAVGATESLRPSLTTPYGLWFGDLFPANPIRDDEMADAGAQGMMALSGRGPTQDGRIAPHVVAPGTWIASMRSSAATSSSGPWGFVDPYYMYMGGTSMSTPLVSGGAALVRQAYQARGHQPSAALVKATLIQSARDIPGQYAAPYGEAGPIPNGAEGWGVIDLAAAISDIKQFRDEGGQLNTGQTTLHAFVSGRSSKPARFTLVWTDYPAAVEAAVSLVNDLDLEVTTPSGEVYRGNVFGQVGGVPGSWSVQGGAWDRVNNTENVYLPATQSGLYRVRVIGRNVPMHSQSYALLSNLSEPYEQELHLPLVLQRKVFVTPTSTYTPSPTATASRTPTATASPTQTASPTATPSPSRTATASRTATRTVSPTATQGPSPTSTLVPGAWCDDFSVDTGRWVVATTPGYAMTYVDQMYRIQVWPETARKGSLAAGGQPGDRRLEVLARAANQAEQSYGIIFYVGEGDAARPLCGLCRISSRPLCGDSTGWQPRDRADGQRGHQPGRRGQSSGGGARGAADHLHHQWRSGGGALQRRAGRRGSLWSALSVPRGDRQRRSL